MKKKVAFLTLSLVLILSLVSASALAKENQTNGKPFEELWDKISEIVDSLDNLQAQITEIQLIEGPQGPQGEEGPQGPPGAMPFSGQICPDGLSVSNRLAEASHEHGPAGASDLLEHGQAGCLEL